MSTAVAPEPVVTDDAATIAAQAQVDALEAAKVTPPVEAVAEPVEAAKVEPTETDEQKETRLRDELGKFAKDYSKVTLPKDAVIDGAVLDETVATARAQGLSVSQTQAVVDLLNTRAASMLADHAPGGATWTKQLDSWKAETLADTTLGATPEERTAAINRGVQVIDRFAVANPEQGKAMKEFLDASGLGERREVAHFFAWLGKSAGEGTLVIPGAQSGVSGRSAVEQKYIEAGMNP